MWPIALALALNCFAQQQEWERSFEAARQLVGVGQYVAAAEKLEEARQAAEAFGPDDLRLATIWNALGRMDTELGRYREAERALRQAVRIYDRAGRKDQEYASMLRSLSNLYSCWHWDSRAQELAQRAFDIHSKTLPTNHPDIAKDLRLVAHLDVLEGRYREAESLDRRALAIWNLRPEGNQIDIALTLNDLANILGGLKRHAEAEPLLEQAVALAERSAGTEHPLTGLTVGNLGALRLYQRRNTEAERLLARALAINERALGAQHPDVAVTCMAYAQALRRLNRKREAKEYEKRAQAIRANHSAEDASQYTVDVRTLMVPPGR